MSLFIEVTHTGPHFLTGPLRPQAPPASPHPPPITHQPSCFRARFTLPTFLHLFTLCLSLECPSHLPLSEYPHPPRPVVLHTLQALLLSGPLSGIPLHPLFTLLPIHAAKPHSGSSFFVGKPPGHLPPCPSSGKHASFPPSGNCFALTLGRHLVSLSCHVWGACVHFSSTMSGLAVSAGGTELNHT